eukprot:COSAG06_NODE_59551_length_274_cov_0.348571_1_plen_21_part_10
MKEVESVQIGGARDNPPSNTE